MIPYSSLNIIVNKLIKNVSTKVLNKYKLTDDNNIIVDKGFEFSCDIFNKLYLDK